MVPAFVFVENPLAYYATLSAAMSACIYLFAIVKQDLRSTEARLRKRIEAESGQFHAACSVIETKVGEWADRSRATEEKVELLSASRRASLSGKSIDLNQRTEVIRLAKRGERPEHIAAALDVPKNEVDLLLKVHRAVVRVF